MQLPVPQLPVPQAPDEQELQPLRVWWCRQPVDPTSSAVRDPIINKRFIAEFLPELSAAFGGSWCSFLDQSDPARCEGEQPFGNPSAGSQ
jgi:hypothetical protein